MANHQFSKVRLTWILLVLLLGAVHADADTLPYWGDYTCWELIPDCNPDPFPHLFATFTNPETGASTIEEIQLRVAGHGIFFEPGLTAGYRIETGCLTCDVYLGVLYMDNVNGNGFDHPADVYTPFGWVFISEIERSTMVFTGTTLKLFEDITWIGSSADGTYLTRLRMAPDETWNFRTENDDEFYETHGTWRDRLTVSEGENHWILLAGIMLVFGMSYRARKRPFGPPADLSKTDIGKNFTRG